nr:MAG TPA: hypothetical protein [Crassvirales sp.]
MYHLIHKSPTLAKFSGKLGQFHYIIARCHIPYLTRM